ncbi:phage tail domain-containing protein [Desemzia incerta]|uniref:phage tail domain-containing protein n=1 Tax=Desemzia incerta TaxID=82801 RepID=UPI003D0650EF
MPEKLRYLNSEGEELVFWDKAPFYYEKKEGFDAVETNVNTFRNYNQDGESLLSKNLGVRNPIIEGTVIGETLEEFYELRKKMISVLNHTLSGTLIYENNNGSYEIDVIPEIVTFVENEFEVRTQDYRITWLALDPYWRDSTFYNSLIPLSTVVGKLEFPLFITNEFEFATITSGDIIEIKNNGDVEVGAIFYMRFVGSVVNPRIYNVLTQEYFGFEGTFTPDAEFKISTIKGAKEVVKTHVGKSSNAMSSRIQDSTFLTLRKGTNYLQVQAESGTNATLVDVSFKPLVLGV